MNCRHVERLLVDYLDGALAPEVARSVVAHLDACRHCRRRQSDFASLTADLRRMAVPPTPPGLARRAVIASSTGTPRPATRRSPLVFSRVAWATAGIAIVGLVALGRFAGFRVGQAPRPSAVLAARNDMNDRRTSSSDTTDATATGGARRHPSWRVTVPSRPAESPLPSDESPGYAYEAPPGLEQPASSGFRRNSPVLQRRGRAAGPEDGGASQSMGRERKGHPRSGAPRDGVNDLAFLNHAPAVRLGPTTARSRRETAAFEAQLRAAALRGDDFVTVPLPRLAFADGDPSRVAAEAVASYKREAAVIDVRLFRKVTLAAKATALSDLCDQLRTETGILLTAGGSVADEKVTLFCRNAPLRDVMRQLGRPFGYAWLRSGKQKEYRYELVQDLRSQLLEEELRNRDRSEALLALDREIERYRKHLDLSPDEALERAKNAPPEEKKLLEQYATTGWAPVQLYFRLTPTDMAALRAGQTAYFGPEAVGGPDASQNRTADAMDLAIRQLPTELGHGALQGLRDYRVRLGEGRPEFGTVKDVPDGVPPAALPNPGAVAILSLDHNELGQYSLFASTGVRWTSGDTIFTCTAGDPLALGVSPMVARPDNRKANAHLARDPSLEPRVTISPADLSPAPSPLRGGEQDRSNSSGAPPSPLRGGGQGGEVERTRLTSADVLDAVHRATGMNLVADYYTRLYPASEVSVRETSRFDALNRLSDTMGLHWDKEAGWLRFRSASYFSDRLKEVPNRLLRRWGSSRRQHGALTLDDLIEIAQLTDVQLDSRQIAEGVRLLFGLEEWPLPRHRQLRHHLRYLATLSPTQRQEAQSPRGLPFTEMALTHQQGFLSLALARDEASKLRLEDLAGAGLHVVYMLPGAFQWARPLPPGTPLWQKPLPSPVREPTREAVLAAARRIDPTADASQVVPTILNLEFVYTLNPEKRRQVSYYR